MIGTPTPAVVYLLLCRGTPYRSLCDAIGLCTVLCYFFVCIGVFVMCVCVGGGGGGGGGGWVGGWVVGWVWV